MNETMRWFGCLSLVAAVALLPRESAGQEVGRFQIAPRVGYIAWDDGAALQDPVLNSDLCDFPDVSIECASGTNNLFLGLSALYEVVRGIGVGVSFNVTRPVTNGTYFPAAVMDFVGRAELHNVSQRLTIIHYAFEGQIAPRVGRVSPFGIGSIGGYTVYLDAVKSASFNRFTHLFFSIGGGLDIAMRGGFGFRVEARDYVYTNWERDKLNPIRPDAQETRFRDLLPVPPEACETCHNFSLAIGFTYVPGGPR